MDYSMRSLFFDPAGWLGAWRHNMRSLSVWTGRKARKLEEERLYEERLQQTKREYVRQVMEAYARRRA